MVYILNVMFIKYIMYTYENMHCCWWNTRDPSPSFFLLRIKRISPITHYPGRFFFITIAITKLPAPENETCPKKWYKKLIVFAVVAPLKWHPRDKRNFRSSSAGEHLIFKASLVSIIFLCLILFFVNDAEHTHVSCAHERRRIYCIAPGSWSIL